RFGSWRVRGRTSWTACESRQAGHPRYSALSALSTVLWLEHPYVQSYDIQTTTAQCSARCKLAATAPIRSPIIGSIIPSNNPLPVHALQEHCHHRPLSG